VGVDYATGMVRAAAHRHADESFVQADATRLPFADASFDVVVFSFNGLDCIHPAARRLEAIDEMRRVLRPRGRAIVSGHNPRAFIVAPRPLRGVAPKVAIYRAGVAVRDSVVRLGRAVRTRPFWTGSGYYPDPEHGGNLFHAATPDAFVDPLVAAGFVRTGGPTPADHPQRVSRFRNGWYYYVFDRAD
jgi:SAM-dependent methyltransferase